MTSHQQQLGKDRKEPPQSLRGSKAGQWPDGHFACQNNEMLRTYHRPQPLCFFRVLCSLTLQVRGVWGQVSLSLTEGLVRQERHWIWARTTD